MDRRRLVLIVLCTLLLVSPLMVPFALWFSNVSTGLPLSLTDLNYVNGILTQQSTPIYAKGAIFVGTYFNLNTSSPLVIELSGMPQVDSVNFNLSSITAPNYTIRIAEYPSGTVSLWGETYAMSFKMNQNQTCYLYNISLFLIDVKNPPNQLMKVDFAIFNATGNSTHIIPNKNITSWKNNTDLVNIAEAWKTIDITSPSLFGDVVTLNPNNTDNATFFVVLTQNITAQSKKLNWAYTNDPNGGDGYGPAYNLTSGTLNMSVDFSMRVYLSASKTSDCQVPYPSEINLKIKGIEVQNSTPANKGEGVCNIAGNFSSSVLVFYFSSTWFDTVNFTAHVEVYGTNLFGSLVAATLFQGYTLGSIFENQGRNNIFLIAGIIGAVAVAGASLYRTEKKRRIPVNAMRNMESIIVDHNPTGNMIWSFDFISMQQDITLVSGFMSAIKTFLEEMKVGGLKRLGTEFGTFIREETQMLTATCISGEIGLDEEFWIRGKLHEFLIKIEQHYHKELEGWKGNVAQFRETFPTILASLIKLDEVQELQRQKIEKLARNKDSLQKNVNKYGEKLEELKSRYDSGEIDFKKYIIERYKTEAKYDKVQKDYLYAGLFISRAPSLLEKKLAPKDLEKMEKLQNRFLEVRKEIEALENKELKGSITSQDITLREKLQKELMSLIEKLDKFKE